MPPVSKYEHRANPVLQKNDNAGPRQEQKYRHTVVDPRRRDHSDRVNDLRWIRSVLCECDRIRVVQQNAPAYVVRV
jgi:hypothetical protein